MIISRAPHRITFSGGGTDMKDFFEHHSTNIIGSAIALYCYVAVVEPIGKLKNKFRLSYSTVEDVDDIDDIKHPIIKAVLRELNFNSPLHINSFSDVPSGTGLGTSSAFTVALLNSLYELKGTCKTQRYIAEEAIYIEREVVGAAGGVQDQYWSANGGAGSLEFSRDNIYLQKIENSKFRKFLAENIYLLSLGEQRSSDVATRLSFKNIENKKAQSLKKMSDISLELKNKLLTNTLASDEIIRLMKNSLDSTWHEKRKQVHLGNSAKYIDGVLDNLGISRKLCGAGVTGFFLTIASDKQRKQLAAKSIQLKHITPDYHGVKTVRDQ